MKKLHVFMETAGEMEEVAFSRSLTGLCFQTGWVI